LSSLSSALSFPQPTGLGGTDDFGTGGTCDGWSNSGRGEEGVRLDLRLCRGEDGRGSWEGEFGTSRESEGGSLQSRDDLARRIPLEPRLDHDPVVGLPVMSAPKRGEDGEGVQKLCSLALLESSEGSGLVGELELPLEKTDESDGETERESDGRAIRTGGTFSMTRRDAWWTWAAWSDESESERRKAGRGGGKVGESHVPSSSLVDMGVIDGGLGKAGQHVSRHTERTTLRHVQWL
jgi:hypothetical protein